MTFYVAAYDTEAVYPWWRIPRQGFDYSSNGIKKFLAGVRAVADIHKSREAPASFFVVAKMLKLAGAELHQILDEPLFDIQSHSLTHADLISLDENNEVEDLHFELVESKRLIEDQFGRPVNGLTAPGGYTRGFSGRPRILEFMREAGYQYSRSVGAGPQNTNPAPINQSFWYTEEGFSELLETPSHGWHDNILTGQPGRVHWPPVLPWGYPSAMPQSAYGVYEAFAPAIDHFSEQKLLYYMPIFHPWSIYRVDHQASQIGMLLDHARLKMELVSCNQLHQHIANQPSLANNVCNID